ncbi:MAG: hypothetical protein ABIP95_01050 [Pelobium sp.]
MKKYLLIIAVSLSLSSCSQTKSETNTPKHFLSDDALEFDLVGKIKKIDWVKIDSTMGGNDGGIYKGYYKGKVDSVKLLYDNKFRLVQSDWVSRSLQTYHEDINGKTVFKNEKVLLDTFSNIKYKDINSLTYRMLIKDNKLVDSLWIHRIYYNKNGDIKEAQVLDKAFFHKKKMTEKIEYKYKYDENGNWIERTIISGAENERFLSQKEVRKIEYQ